MKKELKKVCSFTLEEKVYRWLKKRAKLEEVSTSSFLNNFIRVNFKHYKTRKAKQ